MKSFFKEVGIKQQFAIPYTPEQVGDVERINQDILNDLRVTLHDSGLSWDYWVEVLTYINYMDNARNTCTIDEREMTALEAITGQIPDASMMHRVGCRVFVHNRNTLHTNKKEPKALEGTFLGISTDKHAYIVLIEGYVNQISERLSVTFDENKMP